MPGQSLNKTCFYLIGFQRSGTTLLCHLLDKHPAIICVEEPEISKRIVYKQIQLLQDTQFDSIKKALDFYAVEPSQYENLVDDYISKKLDTDKFLRYGYDLFNGKGADIVGAKEVLDLTSFRYNYFKKLIRFHNRSVKIISIERDIKGVVASFIKLGFFPPGKREITHQNMKKFVKAYLKCLNNRDKYLPDDAYRLSYENFINAPEEELQKIYRFLGADSSEKIVKHVLNTPSRGIRNNFRGIIDNRPASWKLVLSDRQIHWLDDHYDKT